MAVAPGESIKSDLIELRFLYDVPEDQPEIRYNLGHPVRGLDHSYEILESPWAVLPAVPRHPEARIRLGMAGRSA